MCGIVGYVNLDSEKPVAQEMIQRMTDTLVHRGPDGEGVYLNKSVGLGHRRLSIIDLTTGNQPMYNDDRSIAIVFNGEIYNYIELRDELIKLGHHFNTQSDTEIIIHAYEQWGLSCQNELNGMWAFALWDDNQRQLFLSRDRIGEKPLHYAVHRGAFIFASEIKSILALGILGEPRLDLLELYLFLGFIPAPFSFYRNISKLKPGHYLIVKEGKVEEYKYWDLPRMDETETLLGQQTVHENFQNLLLDAVKIRMRSDVSFGAFLSGGLDSGCIVALMSEISGFPVETFTIDFGNKDFDLVPLAREIALSFHCNHHEKRVDLESFDEFLKKILSHYDEPFGDSSAIPMDYLCKFARQKVKMVLTGDGGDELLSGYTAYQGEKFVSQYTNVPRVVRSNLLRMASCLNRTLKRASRYRRNRILNVLQGADLPFTERLITKTSLVKKEIVKALLPKGGDLLRIEDYIADFMGRCPYRDNFYKRMYFDFKLYLPEDMLVKVDRISMANSLETRIPFLDHRLIEFMATVPKEIKMRGYERKSVLRRTIGKKLPSAALKAEKRGFVVPLRDWFKEKSFEDKLKTLCESDFGLDSRLIKAIVEENKQGLADNGNFIWMIFVLERWLTKQERASTRM